MSRIKADSSGPAGRVPDRDFIQQAAFIAVLGISLRRSGIIGDDVYRQIEAELDWQEMGSFTPDTSAQP
jgi:hypothetical protein